MEIPEKTITISLPDDNTTIESSDTHLSEAMEIFQNRIIAITQNLTNTFQVGQTIAQVMEPALEKIAKSILSAQELSTALKPLQSAFERISTVLSDTIVNITIPELSDEQKKEVLESHQQWGKMGWTWFQDESLDFYDAPPTSFSEANTKVKPLCSAKNMKTLFNDLRNQKIKKDDLESAIYCYNAKQYKACSLLLFGLIDAKLIKMQPKTEKKRRAVGGGAVKWAKKQFDMNPNMQAFRIMLCYTNLFTCLETFYADGDNFKSEPFVINRNFVSHGMSQRRVRKRDCIQLFLALSNLAYCMEDFHFS